MPVSIFEQEITDHEGTTLFFCDLTLDDGHDVVNTRGMSAEAARKSAFIKVCGIIDELQQAAASLRDKSAS